MARKRLGRRRPAEASDYLLVTRRNPHAPEGLPGFYKPSRDEEISGIVVHVNAAGVDVGEVVEGYTTSSRPTSVHAVAGPGDVVELLPDDYTAWHTPGADGTSLGLEIVWDPADPDSGEDTLEQAARWAAQRVNRHEIAIRHLSLEEWNQARTGLIDGERFSTELPAGTFPWEHFLDLVDRARKRRRPPISGLFRRSREVARQTQAVGRGIGGLGLPRSAAIALGAIAVAGAATVAALQAVGGTGAAECGAYLVAFSDGEMYWIPAEAVVSGPVATTFHAVPFDDGNVYRVPSTAVHAVTLGDETSYLIRSQGVIYQLESHSIVDAVNAGDLDATLRPAADAGGRPAGAGAADPDLLALAGEIPTGELTIDGGERLIAFLTVGSETFALPPAILKESKEVPDSALPPSHIPAGSMPARALPTSGVPASDWPAPPPPDVLGLGDVAPVECLEDGLTDGVVAAAPAGAPTAGPAPAPTTQPTPTTQGPATATAPTTSSLPVEEEAPAVADLSGEWSIAIDITESEGVCAGEVDEDYERAIKIEQEGAGVSVVGLGDGDEEWLGSFDGARLVFEGERGEDDGITKARFELSLDLSSGELTGAEFWTWASGGVSCENGLSEVVAIRTR